MEIVKEMPVPIYEVECYECHSVIRYKRSDVCLGSITCPVCGMSLHASIVYPVGEERREDNAAMTATCPEGMDIDSFIAGMCVVRCKECAKRGTINCDLDYCGYRKADNWYCADGEKANK